MYVSNSISRNFALLKRIKFFLPRDARLLFNTAYILYEFLYCISVWEDSIELSPLLKL